MFSHRILAACFVIVTVGCGNDSGDAETPDGGDICVAPELPTEGPEFSLTAAGAPAALFGPAAAPTFAEGYRALRDAGFTRHFPFFGTREIVDRPDGDTTPSTSSGHERFFFDATCAEGVAFAAAREADMEILFPAFFFFPSGESESFDADAFRASYQSYQESCFKDAEEVITGYYNYDEMSSNWAGTELVNRAFDMTNPLPRIENAAALATTMRELSSVPVYGVDGPVVPLLERDRAAIVAAGVDVDALLADYQIQLREFAASADAFGFDAYPVPQSYWFPLPASGDLVRVAREVAPVDARVIAVLQGMSYDAQGGHTGIGASGPPPTLSQTRFMAFDAIVNGAEELLWYGPNFLDLERAEDAAFWDDLLTVVDEIRSLGPVLTGERRELELGEDAAAVAFELAGTELLVVVNRVDAETRVSLPLAGETRLFRHPSGEPEEEGTEFDLGPYEVALFLTAQCP